MPEEPTNAMLLSAINAVFERLDTFEQKVDRRFDYQEELIHSLAYDVNQLRTDFSRHLLELHGQPR